METTNQLLACGFMTPEAVLEEFKNPLHVRRFDIYSNPDSDATARMKATAERGWKNSQLVTTLYQLRQFS